ncbi:hypothetical protein [Microbacterium sp. SORGH_AS_0888]|uniref:hypothetical protein n=1 Tax=Microbacterium sp. SORGH_AS_0888 TaxID=3041791 RepID=UPI00278AD70F|nr:hypothetical protein [Microbacterium sp. SORGH_AS_0888]MDQ1129381.1 hypothetical protein [Microbacterium sp. SORGH_AS_0888]
MARIGGRNIGMAWIAGIICAGVVAVLFGLAAPGIPGAVALVGDLLRQRDAVPSFAQKAAVSDAPTKTPECRALYTDALWSQLTQRAGGDPTQDTSAPATAVAGLASALAPTVRVTCTFVGASTGRITTTVADVAADAASVAQATLEVSGFACAPFGDGVRCTRAAGAVVEEDAVRGGVWISTTYDGWRPEGYLDRIAPQIWPG